MTAPPTDRHKNDFSIPHSFNGIPLFTNSLLSMTMVCISWIKCFSWKYQAYTLTAEEQKEHIFVDTGIHKSVRFMVQDF